METKELSELGSRLDGYFFVRGCRSNDAIDLRQETLARCVKVGRLDTEYVFGVAKNVFVNECRRKKLILVEDLDPNKSRNNSRDLAEQNEAKDLIALALASLPTHYRIVLQLKYVLGYRSKRIAKVMGLSENSVNILTFRARRILRRMLWGLN